MIFSDLMTGKITGILLFENKKLFKIKLFLFFFFLFSFHSQKVDRWKRPRANGWILLYGGPAGSGSAKTESTPGTLWPEASAAVGRYLVSENAEIINGPFFTALFTSLLSTRKLFARKGHIHHRHHFGWWWWCPPINAQKIKKKGFPPRRLEPSEKEKKNPSVCETEKVLHIFLFHTDRARDGWWPCY